MKLKVYIVAGEPSGDLLAAGVMRALRRIVPDVEFRGVGGDSMEAVGFKSLFNISEISVMGIFEVLPRLPLILRRIRQTIKDIEEFAPDVLVTVDSWGFVSALLMKLRRHWARTERRDSGRRTQVPVVHYVAPQVWAWKKGRAKNVARLVDRLMTLLPDEGRYFEKYGLQCDFVGHPVVERVTETALDPDGFRAANGIPADAHVISVLPGSRHQEVKRLMPILKDAVCVVAAAENGECAIGDAAMRCGRKKSRGSSPESAARSSQIFVVVPTVTGVEEQARAGFEEFSLPVCVVTTAEDRYNAFAASRIALAKSGTVSLELATLGVPHLIVYTFGRFSNFIAPMLIKVRFANLINIIAGREIIPEFLLGRCRSDLIAECASRLLDSPSVAEKQVADAREVLQMLRLPGIMPSDRAARIIVEVANDINHNN